MHFRLDDPPYLQSHFHIVHLKTVILGLEDRTQSSSSPTTPHPPVPMRTTRSQAGGAPVFLAVRPLNCRLRFPLPISLAFQVFLLLSLLSVFLLSIRHRLPCYIPLGTNIAISLDIYKPFLKIF